MPNVGFPSSLLRSAIPVLAVGIAAIAFAGCEASVSVGGDSIHADEAAATIKKQYKQKTGLTLTSITCESGDAKVGATFTCDAVNSVDAKLQFTAKVDSVNDDKSKVHFTSDVTKATVTGATFADAAIKALAGQGTAVDSMDCPDEIEVVKGKKVDCTASMPDGVERKAVLTLTNGDGDFDVDIYGPVGNPS